MHNNNYYNDKRETRYEAEWLYDVTWTMPTAKHECPFISLHTFKILYFLEFSLIYKIGISSKWSPFGSSFFPSFFFCSSSFSENFAFVPSLKNALTHNNCYYQFLSPFFCSHSRDLFKVPRYYYVLNEMIWKEEAFTERKGRMLVDHFLLYFYFFI